MSLEASYPNPPEKSVSDHKENAGFNSGSAGQWKTSQSTPA